MAGGLGCPRGESAFPGRAENIASDVIVFSVYEGPKFLFILVSLCGVFSWCSISCIKNINLSMFVPNIFVVGDSKLSCLWECECVRLFLCGPLMEWETLQGLPRLYRWLDEWHR